MWKEQTKSGKTRFVERYTNPLNNKDMKISITVDKVTKAIEKDMPFMLQEKFESKINELKKESEKDYTFEAISKEWLKLHKERVKLSTYRNHVNALSVFNKEFGDQLLSEISKESINKYFLKKLQSKEYGYSHAASVFNLISRVIKYAYKFEGIDRVDLLSAIEIPKLNLSSKDDLKYLTDEELQVVFNYFKDQHKFEHLRLVQIQVSTGLRFNELVSLRESDFDFDNNCITVERNYDFIGKNFTSPKSGFSRTVYFNNQLIPIIKEQIIISKMKAVRYNLDRNDLLLFQSKHGNPFILNKFNLMLRDIEIEGKKVTSHIFRHTYITKAVEQGINKDIIARQVGHADTKMIDKVYAHFTEQMEAEQKEAILNFKII